MEIKTFLEKLSERTPYNFCDYSDNSIYRRIQKMQDDYRMTLEQMLGKVGEDPSFINKLVDDITVNTTELFRDPDVWSFLYDRLYPQLQKKNKLTFWHAGCSSGQEVYTNMILMHQLGVLDKCRIIGTDINVNMLQKARAGVYAKSFNSSYRNNFDEVMHRIGSKSRFEDYFDIDEANDTISVKDFLKKEPKFYQYDLVTNRLPFAYKVDVVFFRNVMIYFKENLQIKVINTLTERMYQGGSLVLGKRETLPLTFKGRYVKDGLYYTKL